MHQLRQQLDLAAPDRLRVRLVDEQLAAVHVGVERDDLRALRLRLLQRRADRLRIVAGDDDAGGMRLDRRLDRGLLGSRRVLGARRDDLLVTERGRASLPPRSAITSYGFSVSFGMK